MHLMEAWRHFKYFLSSHPHWTIMDVHQRCYINGHYVFLHKSAFQGFWLIFGNKQHCLCARECPASFQNQFYVISAIQSKNVKRETARSHKFIIDKSMYVTGKLSEIWCNALKKCLAMQVETKGVFNATDLSTCRTKTIFIRSYSMPAEATNLHKTQIKHTKFGTISSLSTNQASNINNNNKS